MQARDLSIVVPVLNDAAALRTLLPQLLDLGCEIIVADGGSQDLQALPPGVRWLRCAEPGRGQQLAAAVAIASGQWYWLLHADSCIDQALHQQLLALRSPTWGRFDVRFQERGLLLRLVALMMNERSRLTGICTGDQGMFVHRSLLQAVGGVPQQPLMEDVELSHRLKRLQKPLRLPGPLLTSARRWQQRGLWRTVVHMWWLRLRYWCGAAPERLAASYYRSPR